MWSLDQDHQKLTKDGWRELMPWVEQHVSSTSLVLCGGRGVVGAYNYYVTWRSSPYKAPRCAPLLPAEIEAKSKPAPDAVLVKMTTRSKDSAETIETLEKLQWGAGAELQGSALAGDWIPTPQARLTCGRARPAGRPAFAKSRRTFVLSRARTQVLAKLRGWVGGPRCASHQSRAG